MRSESCTFIWQPKVSIRYLRAISAFLSRTFAFRFRLSLGRSRAASLLEHLTGGAPQALGNRLAAEHARDFLHAAVAGEPADRRPGAAALDQLLDREVRIGGPRNPPQVPCAPPLEPRAQPA